MKIKLKLSCLNTGEVLIKIVEFRKFFPNFHFKNQII
jgi:hypothetical protein